MKQELQVLEGQIGCLFGNVEKYDVVIKARLRNSLHSPDLPKPEIPSLI